MAHPAYSRRARRVLSDGGAGHRARGQSRHRRQAARSGPAFRRPGPGAAENGLGAVTAPGPCNVWAVGFDRDVTDGQVLSLAEHWNGTAWQVVPTPSPDTDINFLSAVSEAALRDMWAVGETGSNTFIVHWNGQKWTQTTRPRARTYGTGTAQKTFIARWNGTAWKQVPSPSPGTSPSLFGVAAASPSDAWAVGGYTAGTAGKTLIARWNGTAWKQTASPSPGTSASSLRGVTATSASNVWAVGDFSSGGPSQVIAIHCC